MSQALAKEIGEEMEWEIGTNDPDLELVGDGEADWFDARRSDGTETEIKTCAFRISDGESSRRGRFLIKRRAHNRLLEAGGRYRFGVYLQGDREIVVVVDVPAEVVEEEIERWNDPDSKNYEFAQLRWPRVIPVDEVDP